MILFPRDTLASILQPTLTWWRVEYWIFGLQKPWKLLLINRLFSHIKSLVIMQARTKLWILLISCLLCYLLKYENSLCSIKLTFVSSIKSCYHQFLLSSLIRILYVREKWIILFIFFFSFPFVLIFNKGHKEANDLKTLCNDYYFNFNISLNYSLKNAFIIFYFKFVNVFLKEIYKF